MPAMSILLYIQRALHLFAGNASAKARQEVRIRTPGPWKGNSAGQNR
jgi:hypothetical protein